MRSVQKNNGKFKRIGMADIQVWFVLFTERRGKEDL
jgi:hypothetical protein